MLWTVPDVRTIASRLRAKAVALRSIAVQAARSDCNGFPISATAFAVTYTGWDLNPRNLTVLACDARRFSHLHTRAYPFGAVVTEGFEPPTPWV